MLGLMHASRRRCEAELIVSHRVIQGEIDSGLNRSIMKDKWADCKLQPSEATLGKVLVSTTAGVARKYLPVVLGSALRILSAISSNDQEWHLYCAIKEAVAPWINNTKCMMREQGDSPASQSTVPMMETESGPSASV